MAATRTAHQEKQKQQTKEKVRGGAGDWIIMPNGKFWDRRRAKWVLRCHGCFKTFYAERSDARTCSPACRKKASRRTLKQNQATAK